MHLCIEMNNIILFLVHCKIYDIYSIIYNILTTFIQNIENDCETFHTLANGNAM